MELEILFISKGTKYLPTFKANQENFPDAIKDIVQNKSKIFCAFAT